MNEQLIRDITIKVLREMAIPAKDVAQNHVLPGYGSETVPIGVSARHVHLCRQHMDILFGSDSQLTFFKELMGGQYAAAETVTIVGKNTDTMLKARVLGPLRSATQVEVSLTDARALGISAPVRDSGDIKDSAPFTLIGPKGAVRLDEGCIAARRHIHMSPADAQNFDVQDKDVVQVQTDGPRGGILSGVLVRVDASFTLEMHIDTDEANALGIATGTQARIIK